MPLSTIKVSTDTRETWVSMPDLTVPGIAKGSSCRRWAVRNILVSWRIGAF